MLCPPICTPLNPIPFTDRVHPRRTQEPCPYPFVGRVPLLIQFGNEFVGYNATGKPVCVHKLCRSEGENVNVSYQGNVGTVFSQELENFMKFSGVVADLRHDKPSPGNDLLFSLKYWIICSASVTLKGETAAPAKNRSVMLNCPFKTGILQSPVHLPDQLNCMHWIEIENRRGPSLKAGYWIISAHDQ